MPKSPDQFDFPEQENQERQEPLPEKDEQEEQAAEEAGAEALPSEEVPPPQEIAELPVIPQPTKKLP